MHVFLVFSNSDKIMFATKHRLLFIKSTVAGKYSFEARIKDDFFQSMFPEASIDKFFCLLIRSKTIFIVLHV